CIPLLRKSGPSVARMPPHHPPAAAATACRSGFLWERLSVGAASAANVFKTFSRLKPLPQKAAPTQPENEVLISMIVVAALYRFTRLDNFAELREPLLDLMLAHNVRGTLLLASEGVN